VQAYNAMQAEDLQSMAFGKKKTDMDLAGLQHNAGGEYTERDVSKKKKKN